MEEKAARKIAGAVKGYLIKLAVEDRLPTDLAALDIDELQSVIEGAITGPIGTEPIHPLISDIDVHYLLKMEALVELARSEEAWGHIWEEFWSCKTSLGPSINVEYCDPDTTEREDILAAWQATLQRLDELGLGLEDLREER